MVHLSDLEKELGLYLETNGKNNLTLGNMPVLDLGDRPKTYNPKRTESEQLFLIPECAFPNKIVVKYADCKPAYNVKSLREKYKKSCLENRGITFEDF